jgi:methyltransferase (TIGR00027 family)
MTDHNAAVLPPVGVTGVGVATLRAMETARPDRLFNDPYAASFVRAAGLERRPTDEAIDRTRVAAWIAVRTHFLDGVVLSACAGRCRQVVLMGAGLDARAFRLDVPPATRLFELDLPDVQGFKQQVIAAEGWRPACERITVPVDLSDDWSAALLGAGFDAHRPAVWLAEGLLAYLTPEARDLLLARAAELSVPESRMGLTLASSKRLQTWQDAHPDGTSAPADYVALWQSSTPENAVEWLDSLGWRAELFDAAERADAYGRSLEEKTPGSGGSLLVDATRR